MSNFFSQKLYSGLRAALPAHCVVCGGESQGGGGDALVCAACRHELPRVGPACPRCALASTHSAVCGDCFVKPPPLRFVVAAFRYAFPVDRMVQALK